MLLSKWKLVRFLILLAILPVMGCFQSEKSTTTARPAGTEGKYKREWQVTTNALTVEKDKEPKWEWQITEEEPEEVLKKKFEERSSEFSFPKKLEKAEATPAVTPEGDKITVSINFQSADIKEVLQLLLGDLLDVNYTLDREVAGKITLRTSGKFHRSELLQIVQAALNINGFAYVRKGNILEVMPINEARQEQGVVDIGRRVPTSTEDIVTQIVPCENITPQSVIPTLRAFMTPAGFVIAPNDTHALVISDKASNMERLLTIISTFDVPFFAGKAIKFYDILHANAQNLAKDLDNLAQTMGAVTRGPNAQISFIPFQDTNRLLVATNTPEFLPTVNLWIKNIDTEIPEKAMKLYVYKLQHQKAESIAAVLHEVYERQIGAEGRTVGRQEAGERPAVRVTGGETLPQGTAAAARGPMKIIAEPDTNSLIIKASPRDYQDIRRVIEILDSTPKQVLIEVLIAEVTLNDKLAWGVEYFLDQDEFSIFSNLLPGALANTARKTRPGGLPGVTRVFRLKRDISFILTYLESLTEVEVLATPHILVQDEETATIQVGAEEPILTQQISIPLAGGSVEEDVGGTFSTQNQVEYKDTGVILTVTPRIGENQMVSIEVTQEVTNIDVEVTEGISSPRFTTRKSETVLTVEDEHTIIIGGIIERRYINTVKRIPIISRVPIIGNLFKSEDREKKRTELLMLLTPHVVSNTKETDQATQDLKKRMKLIESLKKKNKP